MPSILCVDDTRDHLDVIAEKLQGCGYDVTTAAAPEEALRIFDMSPFNFDVVLTDLLFKNSPLTGRVLMEILLDRRDERGYGVTPEIICLTGEEEMFNNPHLANDIKLRGGQYVEKGSEQFIREVRAAIQRVQKFKEKGPTLLFVHSGAEDIGWSESAKRKRYCPVGESISGVYFIRSGQLMDDESIRSQRVPLSPIHARLLDFFARHTVRRPMRLQEVADLYSEDPFYARWFNTKYDQGISRATVKAYVKRIRTGFDAVGLKGSEILVTEGLGQADEKETTGDVAYRLHAWPIIQHVA
jgi:CheY-like chemotaxis protein